MLVGYARVSTPDQNLELQQSALEKAGCEKIYKDQISGSRGERPGLKLAFEVLRAGDILVVWKLDRLGRSLKGLIELVGSLEERGIHFKSLTDNVDTSSSAGKFFFHIMASLAQMERELIIERTRSGLLAARENGRVGGRKRKMTQSKVELAKKLLTNGITPQKVASNLGVSIPTLYRWVPASMLG